MADPSPLSDVDLGKFAQSLATKPGEMLGKAWEAYGSAAPGLGIPGGGVPGAFTSAAAVNPRLLSLLNQFTNMKRAMASPFTRQIIDNPEHPFAREIATAMPKAYKYAEQHPARIQFQYSPTVNTMLEGPGGATGVNRAGTMLIAQKANPVDALQFYRENQGFFGPGEITKAMEEYGRSGYHEFQHILDALKAYNQTGQLKSGWRGGQRAEEMANTVGRKYPDVKEWYDLVAPSYKELYENLPGTPSFATPGEALVEGAAKHIQDLQRRRAATP